MSSDAPDSIRQRAPLTEGERAALLALLSQQEVALCQLLTRFHEMHGVNRFWLALAVDELQAGIEDLHRAIER